MQREAKKAVSQSASPHEARGFHVEIDKRGRDVVTCVGGVQSILDFNTESALLKVRGGRILIRGRDLSVVIYENSGVEIIGRVDTVGIL